MSKSIESILLFLTVEVAPSSGRGEGGLHHPVHEAVEIESTGPGEIC